MDIRVTAFFLIGPRKSHSKQEDYQETFMNIHDFKEKKKQRKMLPRCNCINFDERKAYSTIQKRFTQNLVTTHRELSEQNHFSNSFLFQTTFKKVSKLTTKCKFEGPFCFGGG